MNTFIIVTAIIAFGFMLRFVTGSFLHLTPQGRANRLLVFPLGVIAPSAWFTADGHRVRRRALVGCCGTLVVMVVGVYLF